MCVQQLWKNRHMWTSAKIGMLLRNIKKNSLNCQLSTLFPGPSTTFRGTHEWEVFNIEKYTFFRNINESLIFQKQKKETKYWICSQSIAFTFFVHCYLKWISWFFLHGFSLYKHFCCLCEVGSPRYIDANDLAP